MKKIQYFMRRLPLPVYMVSMILRKNQGWQDVIELVNCIDPKTKEWSQYAKDNMIDKTPTLLAFDEDGNEVARLEGGEHFTSGFWKATLEKHGK